MYSQVLVLRTTLGLLCILCAYFLGRGLARRDRPARRGSGPLGWAIGGGDRIAPARIRVDTLQQELDEAYARWEELESIHHEDTKI